MPIGILYFIYICEEWHCKNSYVIVKSFQVDYKRISTMHKLFKLSITSPHPPSPCERVGEFFYTICCVQYFYLIESLYYFDVNITSGNLVFSNHSFCNYITTMCNLRLFFQLFTTLAIFVTILQP
jgi:hypothetical protein